MINNRLKKLYIVLVLCLLLTGCSQDLSKIDLEFRERADKLNLSGTTITIMASADWIKEAEMELGSNFEAATGVQVIYDVYAEDCYLTTLFDKLNSGDCPDIFMTQSGFAIEKTYHINEYAIGLAGEPWSYYYDIFSAQEVTIGGISYGMTYYDTTTDYYMVYNKKLFRKAGIEKIPETFEEFAAACESLLAAGTTPIYEPMADGWHQTMLFAETGQVFNTIEPELFDRLNNNEISFSEVSCMKQALEQIKFLAEKGYFGDDFEENTFEDAVSYLASGEYAMCMLKPGSINSILDNDLNNGYSREDFGLMLLPICDNQLLNVHPTGPSRYISRSSDNIEAAKLYFDYITKKDNIQYMIDHEDSVENLPFLAGQTPKYEDVTLEFLNQFDYSNTGTVLQDKVTYFNEQWGEVSANILKLCKGEMSSDELLAEIDRNRTEMAVAAKDPAWK